MLNCICRRALGGLFTGVVLLGFPALLQAASLENRIYLSAGAPWGEPGARAALAVACDDTVGRDTLYLSFEPARDDTGFVAVQGEILFYAQGADTLGSFWAMERGAVNNGGLIAQFGPDPTFPQPQPWTTRGVGSVIFDRTSLSARLRFIFAVPIDHPSIVRAGTRYVLGRLVLGAKRSRLDGCDRPVCVEWHSAALSYKGRKTEAVTHGGSRWLSHAGAAADCRERIPAWRLK
jgi:hypothetical protein